MSTSVPIDGAWTLRMTRAGDGAPPGLLGTPIDATVPGAVHTDLLASGLIADPYLDRNESELAWIGRSTWQFSRRVDLPGGPAGEHVELDCAGLDTVAEIAVNGAVAGHTRNMNRSHRLDVTGLVRAGANDITITFTPADDEAVRERDRIGDLPCSYTHPYNFIRKMACNFGWDWGPDLLTAGIWRSIAVRRWQGARLAGVRPLATLDGGTGVLTVVVDVDRDEPDQTLSVQVEIDGRRERRTLDPAAGTAEIELRLPGVRPWQPTGRGEQAQYDVAVTLAGESGPLDEWTGRVGFRSIRLDTTADPDPSAAGAGSRFVLEINGRPLFVRGVNWIPDDCFPHRVGAADYRQRLIQARDAGVNLIRVWGGGTFETAEFYRACDELGLLVWQDFLFACAAYPEEEPFAAEVEAEARDAVQRLAQHPSLVLWNGCNENIWAQQDWGWGPGTAGRTWGLGFYLELLPRIVHELDPTRPYWPGSPYSGAGLHPNDPDHGTAHLWAVWNDVDYVHYRDSVPRFAGEFGFQGPATYSTLRAALTDEPLLPRSPGMLAHQKAENGSDKLDRSLAVHFGVPAGFDDWHFLASLNQARAVELGITHLRSHQPRCAGTILWQLNDCWPVTSWSVVDGNGRLKPSWYAMRRAYAPRLLTIQPDGDQLALVAVDETGEGWDGIVRVSRRRLADGAELGRADVQFDAPAGTAQWRRIPLSVATFARPDAEFLLAELPDGGRAWWFPVVDRSMQYPPASFDAKAEAVGDGYRVTVTAHSVLRDLTLFADRVVPDAQVDDNCRTLLPGESFAFTVRTPERVDPARFTARPVLRCVNDSPLSRPGPPESA